MWKTPDTNNTKIKTNIEKNRLIRPRPYSQESFISDPSCHHVYQAISIDKIGTIDIDDLFWVEQIDSINYMISIYIPDVTYYLKSNSLIEYDARKQLTSIYGQRKMVTMLPSIFSQKNLRLSLNEIRRCIKIDILFNEKTNKLSMNNISKCLAQNICQLVYEEANYILKNLNRNSNIECMLEIARNISYQIYNKNHALDNRLITHVKYFNSTHIIKEFMTLCNKMIGEYFAKNNIKGLYLCRINNYLKDKNIKTISTYYSTSPEGSAYISFTSPIRKYIDIINHRILKSYLNNKQYYTNYELDNICNYINHQFKCISKDNFKSTNIITVQNKIKIDTFNPEDIKNKIDNQKVLNQHELVYLFFESNLDNYKKIALNKIKNQSNIHIAFNILNSYCKLNNIELVKKVKDGKHNNFIVSNIILDIQGLKYTNQFTGLGLNENESLYNSSYQFIKSYIELKVISRISESIIDESKYIMSLEIIKSNDESIKNFVIKKKKELQIRQLKTCIKNHINKLLIDNVNPSTILNNLQYKFNPIINTVKIQTHYESMHVYRTQIVYNIMDSQYFHSGTDCILLSSKEKVSQQVLHNILEELNRIC